MGKLNVVRPVQYEGIPRFSAGGSSSSAPFQVSSDKDDLVIVAKYSYLLEDFDIKNNIPILGLDYAFRLLYGEKIYLETVFDINGQVAYARIDHQAYWPIQKNDPNADENDDSDTGMLQIYPALIAVLDKDDIDCYTKFLEDQSSGLKIQQDEHIAYLQAELDPASPDYADDLAAINDIGDLYQNALDKIGTMQNSQNSFFSTVSNIRKQVASYNMITYTTQDDDAQLNGLSITPSKDAIAITGDDSDFTVVQCVTKDLMLMDTFNQQTACRYPMEFSRPVYYYKDPETDKAEDDENTDPDNQDNDSSN